MSPKTIVIASKTQVSGATITVIGAKTQVYALKTQVLSRQTLITHKLGITEVFDLQMRRKESFGRSILLI